jgi:hypothetical protein
MLHAMAKKAAKKMDKTTLDYWKKAAQKDPWSSLK